MHRAYQPITPANNKLLMQKWDTIRYNRHRKKVNEAAPYIDNKPPKTYMHLHLKLKNLQIEEERLATVEKENRILLEKMSYIMRTRGQVDNRNDYHQKSLNKTKRQRELLRLTHENQAILKRITAKEPHYNHLEWEEDYKFRQRYMDNIAKYPKYWHKKIKLVPISPRTGSREPRPGEESPKKGEEGAVATKEDGGKAAEAEKEESEAEKTKETEEAEKEADNSDAKEAEKEEAKAEETKETVEAEKEAENQDEKEAEKEEESKKTEEAENEDKPNESETEKSGDDADEKDAEADDETVKEKDKEELVAE